MADWLMKTEPEVFGIDDLAERGREPWNGVRNYQARNHMMAMAVGDRVLFYHSSCDPPGVAGLARVSRPAHPDPTQFDRTSEYHDPKSTPEAPRWFMVEVEFVEKFPTFVPLPELRETPGLDDMLLLRRGMRLSVQPVTKKQFELIVKLGRRGRDRRRAGAARR